MQIIDFLASETFGAILLAILLFLASSVWGTRVEYVFNYRNADLIAYCYAKQANVEGKPSYLCDAAKRYLRVSEDYRRTAVYLTQLFASLIFSVGLSMISIILAFLFKGCAYRYLSLVPLFLMFLLLLVSILSLYLTWSKQPTVWFLNFLANIIPGMRASRQLKRWEFVQELVDSSKWLKSSPQKIKPSSSECETPFNSCL